MNPCKVVVVLGVYRSGSSTVARILHELGVNMGPPFWFDTYESQELARILRKQWKEPLLEAASSSTRRKIELSKWLQNQKRTSSEYIGAKHPLLGMCAADIVSGWGEDVKFIWISRDISESIVSLERKGWWNNCVLIQTKLLDNIKDFTKMNEHLKILYTELNSNPSAVISVIADYLNIKINNSQLNSLSAIISVSRQGQCARTSQNHI